MSQEIEKAKLFTVTGPIDQLTTQGAGITVLFNPTSLKVQLANALKDTDRDTSNRATQYVDKSSSTLTVDLFFDTSDSASPTGGTPAPARDVRISTGAIAREFMNAEQVGDAAAVPKRCMFAWGTFKFVGIMETLDETLDFFSPEGTPLRATLAIKLSESRFQFISEAAQAANRDSPSMGSMGAGDKNWREPSMFNGLESPRLSLNASLSMPSISAKASFSAGASGSAGFSLGASASLGSSISGAFTAKASLTAGALGFSSSSSSFSTSSSGFNLGSNFSSSGSASFSASASSSTGSASASIKANARIGFD